MSKQVSFVATIKIHLVRLLTDDGSDATTG
jgi:hypothetical protein